LTVVPFNRAKATCTLWWKENLKAFYMNQARMELPVFWVWYGFYFCLELVEEKYINWYLPVPE